MKIIDLENWERKTHYLFFKRMDYPQYLICKNIDITNFLTILKEKEFSFYYAMIFAATYVINHTDAFKYRIEGDNVVYHEMIHPSFTAMSEGTDLFKMVTVDMTEDMETFIESARKKADSQKEYFVFKDLEGRTDLIYITCIPWVSFTNLSHTISFNKDDAVPRLAWGKYFEEGDKILIPFSVQAHHSFVDGIHMGQYFDALQDYLDTF